VEAGANPSRDTGRPQKPTVSNQGSVRSGKHYLLENWKRLRAFGLPYFLRSTILGSRLSIP